MRKKMLIPSLLSLFLLVSCNNNTEPVVPPVVDELTGTGSKEDPYVINGEKSLNQFRELFDNQQQSFVYAELANDIELSKPFLGIGSTDYPFTGMFDGKSHKISGLSFEFDRERGAYGLFNYASNSIIDNLDVEGEVNFDVRGSELTVYAGLLAGVTSSVTIRNTKADGNINVTSASKAPIVILGGLVGYTISASGYYVSYENIAHIGAISMDLEDEESIGYAGGISGGVTTSYGSGILAILGAEHEGNITSKDYAGGILGSSSYYVSVQDAYVKADEIVAAANDGSYAGGIIAVGNYETFVAHSVVDVRLVGATLSKTSYKSYAGAVIGLAYPNYTAVDGDYETAYYDLDKGASAFKVDNVSTTITADNVGLNGRTVADLNSCRDTLTDNYFKGNNEVSLKRQLRDTSKTSVTLDFSSVGLESDSAPTEINSFDSEFVNDIEKRAPQYVDSKTFYNYFYDEECKEEYRFYVPFINKNDTLYAGYSDASFLIGSYEYGIPSLPYIKGNWKFTDRNFYWVFNYQVSVYTYKYWDGVIVLKAVDAPYGYDGCVMRVDSKGKVYIPDINDPDYVMEGSKIGTDIVIPDYEGKPFIGKFYGQDDKTVILLENGNAIGERKSTYSGELIEISGGYREISENVLDIKVSEIAFGEFKFDANKHVLYNSARLFIEDDKITNVYGGNAHELKVYVTEKDLVLAVSDGELVAVEGDLVEGGEVLIAGYAYTFSNSALIFKEDVPPVDPPVDPVDPPVDPVDSEFAGVYFSSTNKNLVILKNNGQGIYVSNAEPMTFTWDTETGHFGVVGTEWDDTEVNRIEIDASGNATIYLGVEYDYSFSFATVKQDIEFSEEGMCGYWYCPALKTSLVLGANDKGGFFSGGFSASFISLTWDHETGAVGQFSVFDSEDNKVSLTGKDLYAEFDDEFGDQPHYQTYVRY